jgi:hypothetical protein
MLYQLINNELISLAMAILAHVSRAVLLAQFMACRELRLCRGSKCDGFISPTFPLRLTVVEILIFISVVVVCLL